MDSIKFYCFWADPFAQSSMLLKGSHLPLNSFNLMADINFTNKIQLPALPGGGGIRLKHLRLKQIDFAQFYKLISIFD